MPKGIPFTGISAAINKATTDYGRLLLRLALITGIALPSISFGEESGQADQSQNGDRHDNTPQVIEVLNYPKQSKQREGLKAVFVDTRWYFDLHGGRVNPDFINGDDLTMAGGRFGAQYSWFGLEISGAATVSAHESERFNEDTELTSTTEVNVTSAGAHATLGANKRSGWIWLARAGAGYTDVDADVTHGASERELSRQQVDASYGVSVGYRGESGLGLTLDYVVLGEDLTHAGAALQWSF